MGRNVEYMHRKYIINLWIVHCYIQKTYLSILSNSGLSHKLLWQERKGRFHGSEFFLYCPFIISHDRFLKYFYVLQLTKLISGIYFVLWLWLIFVHGGCTVQYSMVSVCTATLMYNIRRFLVLKPREWCYGGSLWKIHFCQGLYWAHGCVHLKVPKCEIFHLFDFNDFYGIKSL